MPKKIAITIAGAVSLGSYEAGVLFEITRSIQHHNENEPITKNRIVIDVTNQSPELIIAEETLTSSEVVSKALPGARVIKAFSSLYAQFIDGEVNGGKRVLFYCGDDLEAKSIVKGLLDQMGFYPVDLGSLAIGGKMMQYVGGPLSGENFTQIKEVI